MKTIVEEALDNDDVIVMNFLIKKLKTGKQLTQKDNISLCKCVLSVVEENRRLNDSLASTSRLTRDLRDQTVFKD
jgi:hypothetical protein